MCCLDAEASCKKAQQTIAEQKQEIAAWERMQALAEARLADAMAQKTKGEEEHARALEAQQQRSMEVELDLLGLSEQLTQSDKRCEVLFLKFQAQATEKETAQAENERLHRELHAARTETTEREAEVQNSVEQERTEKRTLSEDNERLQTELTNERVERARREAALSAEMEQERAAREPLLAENERLQREVAEERRKLQQSEGMLIFP